MYSRLNIFDRNNRAQDSFTVRLKVDDADSSYSCPRFQVEELESSEIFEKQAECLKCAKGDTT